MLIRNALAGGGARIFTLLIGMIITPYLLANLGPEQFGIWALLTVVTGMVTLGDFSFKTSIIKHLSGAIAVNDRQLYQAVISCSLMFCIINSFVLGLLVMLNIDHILNVLRIREQLRVDAGLTFVLGVTGQLVTICLSIFPALCDARQRLDITNGLGMLAMVVGAVLTTVAIERNTGLPGVALAQLIAIIFFFLTTIITTRLLFGPFGFSIRCIHMKILRTLLEFGLTLHLSTVCGIINRQFDKLLLSRWAGLGWVSSYELAMKWVGSAGSLQPNIAATLLPAGSQFSATGELEKLRSLYFQAYRYLFLLGIPPFFFLAFHASSIMKVWIGTPHPHAATLIVLLSFGYGVNSLSNGMAYICQGVGRPDIQAVQSVIQLLSNIGLSVVLFVFIGPMGAAAGTSLAMFAGASVYVVYFHSYLGICTRSFLRKTAMVPFFASCVAALISRLFLLQSESFDRWILLGRLLVSGTVFSLVFLGICIVCRYLVYEDFTRLRDALLQRKERFE